MTMTMTTLMAGRLTKEQLRTQHLKIDGDEGTYWVVSDSLTQFEIYGKPLRDHDYMTFKYRERPNIGPYQFGKADLGWTSWAPLDLDWWELP